MSPTEPLSPNEQISVQKITDDLEFLLLPQAWEMERDDIAQEIGAQFAHIRLTKQLTALQVCSHTGMTWQSLECLETGRTQHDTISFHSYCKYTEYLGVALRDIFEAVLIQSRETSRLRRVQKRSVVLDEEDILKQVHMAVRYLESSNVAISMEGICSYCHASPGYLRRWPRVIEFLEQLFIEKAADNELREKEVYEASLSAIDHLEFLKLPVTQRAVAKTVGVSEDTLIGYTRIKLLLEQKAYQYSFYQKLETHRREEELVERVREALHQLETLGQPVTQEAIGRCVGIRTGTLRKYPQVKELLNRSALQHKKALRREEELVVKVEAAIEQLQSLGQPIKQRAISRIVGVSSTNLSYCSRVRALLEPYIRGHHSYRERTEVSEDELLVEVSQAVQKLEQLGQSVTQNAICAEIGRSRRMLKAYPRVKALLEQYVSRYYEERRKQFQQHAEDRLQRVSTAVALLEERGESLSWRDVAEMLDVSVSTLHRTPGVQSLLNQHGVLQNSQKETEERLVASVEAARWNLQRNGVPVTLRAIYREVGVSKETLRKHQRVRLLLDEIKDENRKQRLLRAQRDEEELAEEVKRAIQQLEALEQPLTQRAISRLIGKHPPDLYQFPSIVALFKTEIQPKIAQERLVKRQQREDCLIQMVRRAEQELEQRGLPISVRALVEQTQLSYSILYHHTCVYAIVKQIVQKHCEENQENEDK